MKNSFKVSQVTLLVGTLALGCSSSSSNKTVGDASVGTGGSAGSGGSGGSGGGGTGTGGAPSIDAAGCTTTVSPGSDDVKTIRTALIGAKSGDTICLSPGTYTLSEDLSLTNAQNITFRGTGAKKEDTVLDFSTQADGGTGSQGMLVTTDHFTIQNLWIKNTAGTGIKVQAAFVMFDNIKVSWDSTKTSNGGYAIYPTEADHVVIQHSEVQGAADAGIYAGQCTHVIMHDNLSHGNVIGLEVENTTGADVYNNELTDNTCGMLLDDLPDLQKTDATTYLIHDNNIHGNDRANFGVASSLAGNMPVGTGVQIVAATNVELTGNTIKDNDDGPISIVSYDTISLLFANNAGKPDPKTNRYPNHLYIHDNTFSNNGQHPTGVYGLFTSGDAGPKTVKYDVLWDGVLSSGMLDDAGVSVTPNKTAVPGGAADSTAQICLGATEAAAFVNFAGVDNLAQADWSTDPKTHQCTLPPIPALTPP